MDLMVNKGAIHMAYSRQYSGKNLDYVAFPLGGFGAGMFCVEGTGSFSAFSLRHEPNVYLEPVVMSAISIKGLNNKSVARVIEGQVPRYKVFGGSSTSLQGKHDVQYITKANGLTGKTYGLPRFREAKFSSKFPFANIDFVDEKIPLMVSLEAWSPFTPPHEDDSSLPCAFLEYKFENKTDEIITAVYYFAAMNFMDIGAENANVCRRNGGFIFSQPDVKGKPWYRGDFSIHTNDENVKINTALFRGGWFDGLTMLWNDIEAGVTENKEYTDNYSEHSPGACLSMQFTLLPGETKKIMLKCAWYVPDSHLRFGAEIESQGCCCRADQPSLNFYKPWYSGRFSSIYEIADYVDMNTDRLYGESRLFSETFYSSSLPQVILEAVGSNLSILKSPTILRQTDGRLWCWEGCCDSAGCCAGSCTHVWNYAFALCFLFPSLERGMRQTEFCDCENEDGHQQFRASLPIRPSGHDFHAAADGQLGGIIKIYRDFIQYGDLNWLKELWPQIKKSMDYCISTWDKK
jgi:uncharacterized protein (DUF608 family)